MTPIPVLLVSRRASCRSALAQACLRHIANERFSVHTCGVPGQIASSVDNSALAALAAARITARIDPPRSWAAYVTPCSARFSLVITLDEFAAEMEPAWPGQPDTAAWLFSDVVGSAPNDPQAAALQILHSLRRRFEILANFPMKHPDRTALRSDLRDMAYMK